MTIKKEQLYKEKCDTWPKILKYNYERYGDTHKAMRHKRFGIWQPFTWKDYYLNVKYLALGLLSIGFEYGDKVLIIGDNAPEWYYAELASQSNHGVSVGLYGDSTPSEIKYIAENSEARFAIVQDQEQVDKLLQIKSQLPLLKRIIYWNYKGLAHYKDPILTGYREILEMGQKYDQEHPGLFEKNVESGSADDICAIVYTSGTTSPQPKGAIHTFKTMRICSEYHLRIDPWYSHDNIIPYLPPASINEQWFAIGCHLLSASILNFSEDPETQQRDTKEIKPHIVFYGARIWENQAATIQARILGGDLLKKSLFRSLMPIAHRIAELRYKRKRPGLLMKILSLIINALIIRPIKKSIGLSRARICYSTGSTLSPDAFRFYHALNLPLKSIYGTTEGGALTASRNDDINIETVGSVHNGAEIKITENGELAYRHPGLFAGYYKDSLRTSEVMKDGWFHSGDMAYIRKDGHIVFLDRLNDVIRIANGELLFPQSIECRLRSSPYIKDAWVTAGPERKYVSVIIVINFYNVSRWAGQMRVGYKTFADLSQKEEVYELVKKDVERVNQDLSPAIRMKKYVNLHKEFDPDEGELTRTRNLRRRYLEERYRDLINAIYDDIKEIPIEDRLIHRDGRIGTIKTILNIRSL